MTDSMAGEFGYPPLDEDLSDLPDLPLFHSQQQLSNTEDDQYPAPGDASSYHDYHDQDSFVCPYALPDDLQPVDEAGPSQPTPAHHNNNSNKKGKGKARAGPAGTSTALFQCDKCENTYTRQCDLNKHKKNHDKPKKCNFCGEGFAEPKDTDRHMYGHHADDMTPEQREELKNKLQKECPECDYHGRYDNVKRHRKTQHQHHDS